MIRTTIIGMGTLGILFMLAVVGHSTTIRQAFATIVTILALSYLTGVLINVLVRFLPKATPRRVNDYVREVPRR